jgi:nucleotide-binding universal stress UspA family protein
MKTIVATTDFSAMSLNAVNYAADMACSINADFSLLHVCLLPMTYSEVPYPAENITSLMDGAEERMLQLKNDLVKRTAGKIKILAEVRTAATVVTEIEDYCEAQKPYAVVMGTQGSTAFERVFLGSNTIGAMKHLSWPLIVVPLEAKFLSIKKIGLACDLEKVDDSVPFTEIKSLVKEFNAELHVLHINTEGEKGYTVKTMIESRSLQNMLDDLHPVYHFLDDNDIENGLSKFAEDNQLDLLIVVPKKHNIIDQLFHKSHSKKLVLHAHAHVPVMAVHEN